MVKRCPEKQFTLLKTICFGFGIDLYSANISIIAREAADLFYRRIELVPSEYGKVFDKIFGKRRNKSYDVWRRGKKANTS